MLIEITGTQVHGFKMLTGFQTLFLKKHMVKWRGNFAVSYGF